MRTGRRAASFAKSNQEHIPVHNWCSYGTCGARAPGKQGAKVHLADRNLWPYGPTNREPARLGLASTRSEQLGMIKALKA